MASKPTHEQAKLQLELYDLRREGRMRQARDWFFKNYNVNTVDDVMRIAAPGTEGGALANQVISYWEQACALLNYGLLHEDLFFETNGEFFGVWETIKSVVPQFREMFGNQQYLGHLETAAKRFEAWMENRAPGHVARMRQFMQQMRSQAAGTYKNGSNRVVHFEIPVNDIDRSIQFYEKIFGWKFQKWGGPAEYYTISTGAKDQPGIDGGLLRKHDPRQPVANTVKVENVDETIRTVEENGGKCCVPKMAVPGIGWLAYFNDPEGNVTGVMQFDAAAK